MPFQASCPPPLTQHKPRRVECGSEARCGFNAGRASGLEAGRQPMWDEPDAGWGRVDGRCGSGPDPSGSTSTPLFFRSALNAGRASGSEVGQRLMWVGTDAGWRRVDGRCGSGPHPSGSVSTPHFFRPAPNAGRAGGLEVSRVLMWVRCIDPFCVSAIKSNRLILKK